MTITKSTFLVTGKNTNAFQLSIPSFQLGSCELTALSPLVTSLMNSGSGSCSITWKCSMECIDFSELQFLNHITFRIGMSISTPYVYKRLSKTKMNWISLTFSTGTLDLKVLSTYSSICLLIWGISSPVFGSSSRSNLVQTHKCTILGSMPYGQSL